MNYLLDTNTCIYLIRRKPPPILDRVRHKKAGQVTLSVITIAELEYGVEKSPYAARNRIALLEFLVPFNILNFDYESAVIYGKIRTQLESKGTPIGPMDLLLAAQSLAHDLILVTNNEKEFTRVAGLRVENWV